MKKYAIAAAIILLTIFVIRISIMPLIFGVAILSEPKPPQPKYKHGEFPVTIVFERDGERMEASDTIICDYDGSEFSFATGEKNRKWRMRYASGNDEILAYTDNELKPSKSRESDELVTSKVYLYPYVDAYYYMGDIEGSYGGYWRGDSSKISFSADYKEYLPNGKYFWSDNNLNEIKMEHRLKIKIISWESADPIVNEFK